jgi:hypothetical protein
MDGVMKKYCAVTYLQHISIVEVERETTKSVWLKRIDSDGFIQSKKVTNSEGFFDTWEEAKEFLVKMALLEFEQAVKTSAYYRAKYEKVCELKENQ